MEADVGWDCPQCTLINHITSQSCAVCGWRTESCRAAVAQIWSEPTIGVLLKVVGNAADNPSEPKFRGPLRKSNNQIRATILEVPGAADVLRHAGFEEDADCFRLPAPDVPRLSCIRELLQDQQRAIAGRKLPPVKRRLPKFDPDVLGEVQAQARYNEGRWSHAPVPLPATAAATPADLAARAAGTGPEVLRLRLRLPLGGHMELGVSAGTTVALLRSQLHERTGIPVQHQRIRFGYPPQVLPRAEDAPLRDLGMHDGEVVYLENLHDLFLGNVESGSYTMHELLQKLPEGEEEGEGSIGALFQHALAAFNIPLEGRNFWGVIRGRMQLLAGDGEEESPAVVAQLHAGLLVLQRLFRNHDPRQRLALVLESLPGRSSHGGQVQLKVDRAAFLSSVAPQVLKLHRQQLLSPVHVHYVGEPGQDAGGLTRDFFSSFATRLGDDEALLWELTGRGSLQPTPGAVSMSTRHPSKLKADALYRASGRIFGMAVLHGCKLGRQLSHPFVRVLAGDPPLSLEDLQLELKREAGDGRPDYRSGKEILEKPLAECGLADALTFAWTPRGHPELGEHDLVPGGRRVPVTDANKAQWLELLLRQEMVTAMLPAAAAFRQGLVDVFGGAGEVCTMLCLLNADDLIELFGRGGVTREDVSRWRAVARVSPAVERQAEWLWQVLAEDYDDELRGKVLQFATGSSSLGRDGLQSFTVEPADGGDERLPSAMTCGRMLQLPRYSCRAALSERLRMAAEMCTSFQLA